jgi:agmatinase
MPIEQRLIDTLEENAVAVVGAPCDENSTYMRGAAGAPPKIREALNCGSANLCSEDGRDLAQEVLFRDLGDMVFMPSQPPLKEIEGVVDQLLKKGARVLVLGGDHAVTPAILRAYYRHYGQVDILQFDAHPDLYEAFEGNRNSHACPFARIMEEQLAKRLVQVGIRTMNPHQQEQADRFGVEVIPVKAWQPGRVPCFDGPLYISFDMDVLDPAYAPGVSHHEPGGLSTRDVLTVIQNIDAPIVGADIVEFNPLRDTSGMTAMVAAKLMKELASKMLCQARIYSQSACRS